MVPNRYPMAADRPLTAPWAYQDRGSMLGSRDHHQKSSATAVPANVGGGADVLGREVVVVEARALVVGVVKPSTRLLPHSHPSRA